MGQRNVRKMIFRHRGVSLLVVLMTCSSLLVNNAHGQDPVRIELQRQSDTRIPIATPPFAATPEARSYSGELAAVVGRDLAFTGLFKILPQDQYPSGFLGLNADATRIDFESWRSTSAEHLVYAYVALQGDQLVAECRLFDIFGGQQLVGTRLVTVRDGSRHLAHKYADEITLHLTGVAGIASTEITFSVGAPGKKEIYISDYDGSGAVQITQHGSISIKPKFSPDGRKIAYLSYKDRYPFLYIYDRDTGLSTPLSKRVGLNHAPAWSPDGRSIALCLSKDGNTEIYVKNADGTNERRLTNDRSSDTAPTFSPDGKQIAFVSDRAGRPQIYVMDSEGRGAKRISYQGGNAYDPVWSPDGRTFAYIVERSGEGLELYLMDADGTNPQRVTNSAGSNEAPSWSPDSRHVVFTSTRGGYPQLMTATIETGEVKPIARLLRMRAEGPSWGPRRP